MGIYATEPMWARLVAESLVCTEADHVDGVDAILIDELESNYLPFERARRLREAGVGARVLVPNIIQRPGATGNLSSMFVELLARLSRVGDIEVVPVVEAEPISLHVALQFRQYLTEHQIRSVAVVAQRFRSERSMLIYRAVLEPAGIATYCVPVAGTRSPDTWTRTWHGVQDVALQFVKLQYYRFYVMPWRAGRIERP